MFAACSQVPPESSTEYPEKNYSNLVIIRNLAKEQAGLILNNTKNYNTLLLNIDKAALLSIDQNNQCSRAYQTKSYIDCLTQMRSVNTESVKIEVSTARYFAQNGRKEKAEEMYRRIIKTYIGKAYTTYVRQAKSGLEELKEK